MLSGEIKSVYVRNLPPAVSVSEIEEEFKNFGKLKYPEGVVIRSRKVNVLGFFCLFLFVPLPFVITVHLPKFIKLNVLIMCRMLAYAMHLSNSKILAVFRMQSRCKFIFFHLFHLLFFFLFKKKKTHCNLSVHV